MPNIRTWCYYSRIYKHRFLTSYGYVYRPSVQVVDPGEMTKKIKIENNNRHEYSNYEK